jgi:hypothetical protein
METKAKKIVLAGPPRSGKSCLREGLKQALRVLPGAPYPYVITACPDGEGSWFQETVNADPSRAAACKAAYKGKFSPEFVKRIADSVRDCPLELVLIDIGGIPSKENVEICKDATDIILLAGNSDSEGWNVRLEPWRAFAKKLGLRILAEIFSDYKGSEDRIDSAAHGIFRGSVHYLERGENLTERPTIAALAQHIIDAPAREDQEMEHYNVALEGDTLRVGFGDPAQNDTIVREVADKMKALDLPGGPLLKINGPASLPVAVVLAHAVGHLYQAVAVYDPKLGKYVVAVAHGNAHNVGDLID